MKRFIGILDKTLTTVLVVLLVGMVFSITAEIVLNAAVQPIASSLSARLAAKEGAEARKEGATSEAAAVSRTQRVLGATESFVARASAPVNTASETLLVWIGILGSALALRYRGHLGVDALVRVYPYRLRLAVDYTSTGLMALFSLGVFVVGGYLLVTKSLALGSTMPGIEWIRQGWFYLVLPITGLLNLVYCIYHFLNPEPVESAWPEHEQERKHP